MTPETNNSATTDMDDKKDFLLVCVDEFNEDLIQLIFELALIYEAVPYSYKGSNTSFVFDKSEDSLDEFEDALKNLPVFTCTIKYRIERKTI